MTPTTHFNLQLYGVEHLVKDHSTSRKGSFMSTIPHKIVGYISQHLLYQSTRKNEKQRKSNGEMTVTEKKERRYNLMFVKTKKKKKKKIKSNFAICLLSA